MPADPNQTPEVCQPCAAWHEGELRRAVHRALWGGTLTMRAAGATYLPLNEGETTGSQEYQRRLASSYLFPAYRRAIVNLVGKLFSREVTLGKDVPGRQRKRSPTRSKSAAADQNIVAWCENVDLRGTNLHNFAARVETDAWIDGLSLILVDYPPGEAVNATRDDDARAGRRPFLVAYQHAALINWATETVDGRQRLSLAVLREQSTERDGEFGAVSVTRCNAYLLVDGVVQFERWEQRSGEEWRNAVPRRVVLMGGRPATEIPLVALYADPEHGFFEASPPLEDLAWLNVRDWQKLSDLDTIEHVANVPVTVWPGMSGEDVKAIPWGPTTGLATQNPESRPYYLEHTGKAIGELKGSIQDNREMMRLLSMEPMVAKSGTLTATGEAVRGAEAHSALLRASLSCRDGLEQALRYMALYARLGDDAGGSVVMPTKFAMTVREQADLEALRKMRDAPVPEISMEAFHAEMKRREVLGDDFDSVVDQELVANEVAGDLAGAGRERAFALRVAQLVKAGAEPEAALAQAEAERDDGAEIEDDDDVEAAA